MITTTPTKIKYMPTINGKTRWEWHHATMIGLSDTHVRVQTLDGHKDVLRKDAVYLDESKI